MHPCAGVWRGICVWDLSSLALEAGCHITVVLSSEVFYTFLYPLIVGQEPIESNIVYELESGNLYSESLSNTDPTPSELRVEERG